MTKVPKGGDPVRDPAPQRRKRILVIEDEPDVQFIIRRVLQPDYEVVSASDGEAGLAAVREHAPDLMLVDLMLPGMSGIEVVRQIKGDLVWRHVPMIIVTAKGTVEDRVQGLRAGADDYVIKPFALEELQARVRINLIRTERDLDANPLTRLPGNVAIYSELTRRLISGQPFAVCYVDLDRFKAYNDTYGFERGDNVIRQVAGILRAAAGDVGGDENFVGHIGGDDFVIINGPETSEAVAARALERFDERAPSWYGEEDRRRGHIVTVDRRGIEDLVPLMTLSIGIVLCRPEVMRHPAQIGQIGAELKRLAKSQSGSVYVKDRRTYGQPS